MDRIRVDIDDLTDRQIMLAILHETHGLRKSMADLTQAVADLQVAVQGVLDRVGPTVDDLKAQVAAGVEALAAFAAADSTEDAAYEEAIAALQAALQAQVDGAQAAADQIESSVATLNTVVAVVPVEEPPAE
jgi:ABC-type transporter Mla subunit MlaD